jgi:RNA polymerase sigma-70 factor, ECF subfamily
MFKKVSPNPGRGEAPVSEESQGLNALLQKAHALDPQTLAALHDQLYPIVYRYVCFRLADDQACEDITSEAFMCLLDTLQRRASSIRDVRAWLLGTASHLIHDHLRRKYKQPLVDLEAHENALVSPSPESAVEQKMNHKEMRQAVEQLTVDQQQVLALRFNLEYSLESTARSMGRSVSAVKVLQFRALAALRQIIEKK